MEPPDRAFSRAHNLVESAIRPTAIGKKNWLFIGETDAGQRSAIDPYAYLRDVLSRLPRMTNRQISEVTPSARSKAQVQRQIAS
jgi:transposase